MFRLGDMCFFRFRFNFCFKLIIVTSFFFYKITSYLPIIINIINYFYYYYYTITTNILNCFKFVFLFYFIFRLVFKVFVNKKKQTKQGSNFCDYSKTIINKKKTATMLNCVCIYYFLSYLSHCK